MQTVHGRTQTVVMFNVLTTLDIAVHAPMPRAKITIATAVKPGFFSSTLTQYRISCRIVIIFFFYSYRSASMGSILAARRAGIHAARAATVIISTAAPIIVRGS